MSPPQVVTIAILFDEEAHLPLRWTLHREEEEEPFLAARRSFKTREDAYRDAELLLDRCGRPYLRAQN